MLLIESDADLVQACRRWAQSPWLALDTEFVRVDTYHPRLCLLQICDGGDPAVVDVLAVGTLDPVLELLYQPERVKVFHAASQDLEIFVQLRGTAPRPVFDTQTAAALLGEGDQLSYAALVEKRLGIALDKSLTRTDWARRPLRAAELDYAAADVTHLATLYPQMRAELVASDRLAWLAEECDRHSDAGQFDAAPETAWRRLKRLGYLAPDARKAAMALACWREQVAQKSNRPRRWILADDTLYELAERRPRDLDALAAAKSLSPRLRARHGKALIEVIAQAPSLDADAVAIPPALDAAQKSALHSLRARAEARADALCIPPSLLATRADLERIVREGPCAEVRLAGGWRRQAAPELLA